MEVALELLSDWRDRLLQHVAEGTRLHTALKQATALPGIVGAQAEELTLICDIEDAEALVEAASEHCPEAVRRIEKGIRISRSPRRD